MKQDGIDQGREFDWGRTSADYARYRDIYPPEFYQKILEAGIGTAGQRVLDLGTGTGVLPRHLNSHGAQFTGTDISENQIAQARALARAEGKAIEFLCCPAEACGFPDNSFDAVTACQCFFYFNHDQLAPRLAGMLKPGGRLAVLYMAWLPEEDSIAGASERLVLKYNPDWTGGGETRHPIDIPAVYDRYFQREQSQIFDLAVPFTRETWNGRIKACRGIGATLREADIRAFEAEHMAFLEAQAPARFHVLHYAAAAILRVRK